MITLAARFKAARRVGTPLIAISTADQPAAVLTLRNGTTVPVILWDIVRGWLPGNDAGAAAIRDTLNGGDPASVTVDPVECLAAAATLPSKSILFCYNAHRLVSPDDRSRGGAQTVQAVANLRDLFKRDLRTLVLLGPSFNLAPEVAPDILVLDDPLPDDAQLTEIVVGLAGPPKPAVLKKAVDALRGLAAFSAEQATALSLNTDDGAIDLEELWSRKRAMIGATPGLSVWAGGETLEQVGGCDQIKMFLRSLIKGQESPRCIVFIDEIEKSMAGATSGSGDSSGVSQGFLEVFLREMQDNNWSGIIEIGPPGAAKSAVAKGIGASAGIPTIALDLNGMKASLVGQSEERLRTAMKVIKAVGGRQVLVVATCNKIATLPPELRRRFTMGTFFFDLPDAKERSAIWDIYQKQYGCEHEPGAEYSILPRDEGWTGAEIRQCCMLAYRLGITLTEAATYIVPVAKAAAEQIEELRRSAEGRFLSASHPGLYTRAATPVATTAKRQLSTEKVV